MDSLSEIAEGLKVHPKTVRRAARTLGLTGSLVRGRRGLVRAYGEDEAARLRDYFRRAIPEEVQVPRQVEPVAPSPAAAMGEATLALPDVLRPFLDAFERRQAAVVEQVLRPLLAAAERQAEEVRQLREVLAARLPGPPAPPSPPPRFRPRIVLEVVLLGWVGLLAGVLGAVVLQRLADVGVVTLPAWWPIG